jgi:type IV fimbrial biogenesis protein FimT
MRSRRTNQRRAGGFTIVELVFTILIAAVILGIGIPSFRTMIHSNRLVTQNNEVVAAMQFARSLSITRNQPITLCRTDDEDDVDCAATSGEWEFWIVRDPANEVLRRGVLPSYSDTISFNSDLTDDTMVFGTDGIARTGGAVVNNTITVCSTEMNENNVRTITVGAGSRVSTVKSTGGC